MKALDCVGLAAFAFCAGTMLPFLVGDLPRESAQASKRTRNPSNDVIVACLQKEGMPAYAVGPDGPPMPGDVVTAGMVTVICVDEK